MATAVTTRGRIVERCTAGQLVLAFATNVYHTFRLSLSVDRSSRYTISLRLYLDRAAWKIKRRET